MTRRALGRGLRALLPDVGETAETETRPIPIEEIVRNRYQPRGAPEEEGLEELAESIRAHGVLEPIIVRPIDDGYELVVGERRWLAAQRAGLRAVPAIVRTLSDRQAATLALVENLQREELNAIEEAGGYRVLMESFGLTQEQVAMEVGKKRSTVANSLRLLNLEEEIQSRLRRGEITVGHAKVLLGVESGRERVLLAERAAREGLSVREMETLVAGARAGRGKPEKRQVRGKIARGGPSSADLREVEEQLRRSLGTRVRVHPIQGGTGRIEIEYYSDEDLSRILEATVGGGRA